MDLLQRAENADPRIAGVIDRLLRDEPRFQAGEILDHPARSASRS